MAPFGPTSRDQLIACLRRLRFEGPLAGGKHGFMIRDQLRVRIPNPHRGEIVRELLARILRQAAVSREDWESL
jgi:hypothetical protein